MNRLSWFGIGMMLLQSLIYGIPDCFVKIVYREFPVMSFLGCRYFLASSIMLLIWGRQILREVAAAKPSSYVMPAICMGGAFLISNTALKYTTVGNVSFVRSSTPIIAALLLMLFFNRRVTLKDGFNLSVLMGGMYCIATQHGANFLQGFGLGECLSLLSSLALAGALVFGKDALKYVSPISLSWLQCFASFLFCILVGCLGGSLAETDWQLLQKPVVLLTLLYLTILCSIGGLLLQNYALRYINSKLCSVIQCMYPIVASVTAYFVISECPSLLGVLGGALVTLAVILECFNRE